VKDRDETIVKMWIEGASVADISAALEMSKVGIYVRIRRLRELGVKLPSRGRNRPVDVVALNKLIKSAT
jgi:transposase